MKFEHFGINVPDAQAMADWYVKNCNMKIVRAGDGPANVRFLADASGRTIIEIYTNPADQIPDYCGQHQLRFHFAFAVDDPAAIRDRLIDAGAKLIIEEKPDQGSCVITLRDPWGLPLQLCRRAEPMP